MAPQLGAMTVDEVGKYLKSKWAGKSAQVVDTKLNKAPAGLIAAFPVDTTLVSQKIEFPTRTWAAGEINTVQDGAGDLSKWKYLYNYKDLTHSWDKESYKIFDSATTSAAVNRLAMDGTQDILDYFRSCRAFKILTELKAKRVTASTHTAERCLGRRRNGQRRG